MPSRTSDRSVEIHAAAQSDAGVIRNLLELYAHDLSEVFDLDVGADGRYGYPKLPLYWSEPKRRFPFLIRSAGRIAGFALIVKGSPVSNDPDCLDMAEFFVLRPYRGSGVSDQAARLLWQRFAGPWTVRVADENRRGMRFWSRVIAAYTSNSFTAHAAILEARNWTHFAFAVSKA